MSELGLKTAFFAASSAAQAGAAFASSAAAAILKTRRFGYDGKGQAKVASARRRRRFRQFKDAPGILEGFVDFAYEASVVAARGPTEVSQPMIRRRIYTQIISCAAPPCRRG